MPDTYGDVWRRVRLYVPVAPTFLVREWVNVAYKRAARLRHWSFLDGELRLTINTARTLSAVTVTRGSATVTSAGLFLAGDAGRQFRTASAPIYTVQTFTDVNTLQLDIPYGEDTSAVAVGTIFDGFATMPADFESFRLIADPYNQRRLAWWITEDEVNLLDPTWSNTDVGPRVLVARNGGSTYLPTIGRVQYTYWPRPTAARSYPALYHKQAANLDDTSILRGVFADAAQVLVDGALAEAALWPGTDDKKNLYFNATTAAAKKAAFLDGVQHLSLRDDDQSPDDLGKIHWEHWPLADLAFNDVNLRASDASVSNYW